MTHQSGHSRRNALRLLLFPLVLPGLLRAQASNPPPVSAPKIKVGDSWTYRASDAFTKLPRGAFTVRVTRAEASIEMVEDWDDGSKHRLELDFGLNLLRHDSMKYQPRFPNYVFPLEVGKKWAEDVVWAKARNEKNAFASKVSGTVLAREQVMVPAGTFSSLKVRVEGIVHNTLRVGHWTAIDQTSWYVPEVKNAVRVERKEFRKSMPKEFLILEMTDFKSAD